MEKVAAIQLMQDVTKVTDQINVLMRRVEELISGAELPVMRRHMAMMVVAADEHLYRPIVKQFPDLDPHL